MPIDSKEINEAIRKNGFAWMAEDNELSRLSHADLVRRLGVNPPPGAPTIDEAEALSPNPSTPHRNMPSRFDLRNVGGKNYITPVVDQGQCGSCVAFGVVATIEGTMRYSKQDPTLPADLSEAHLYYCHGHAGGATCGTGWWPAPAFEACRTKGLVDEKCFPYSAHDQPCKLCADWAKRLTKVKSATVLNNAGDMKQWISTKGPVAACFIVYEDFYKYSGGVYKHVTGSRVGGHCTSIIGYDDQNGCWICKNSWNTDWGAGGFFKIGYGECAIESWSVLGTEV